METSRNLSGWAPTSDADDLEVAERSAKDVVSLEQLEGRILREYLWYIQKNAVVVVVGGGGGGGGGVGGG